VTSTCRTSRCPFAGHPVYLTYDGATPVAWSGVGAGIDGYLKGDRGLNLLEDVAKGAGVGALFGQFKLKLKLPGSPDSGYVGVHRA
jgi:hypothetical protein